MRIVYVGHGITNPGHGAQSSTRRLLNQMRKQSDDIEFIVVSNERVEESLFSGTTVDHLRWLFSSTKNLARRAKEEKVDLINIHTYGGYSTIPPKGIPSIITPHDSPLPAFADDISPVYIGLAIRFILNANMFFTKLAIQPNSYGLAISSIVKNQLISLGMRKSRIKVLPHGFTCFPEAKLTLRKEDITETLGIPEESKLVISVGGVIYGKGVHRVAQIARITRRTHPDVHFIHVGNFVKIWSNGYYEAMRRRIGIDKIDNFHIFGGVSHDALLSMLKASDVYLSTSYTEGCSQALMEAMIEGMPIVCTDVGAARDLLNNQAEIVPVEASEYDIAKAVLQQINKTRISYPITKTQTWEFVAEQTLEMFREIIRRRERRHD